MLEQDIERVLFTEEALRTRVQELAKQIDRDYAGREPILISVLRGSFVFMADLVRGSITLPPPWTSWPYPLTAPALPLPVR